VVALTRFVSLGSLMGTFSLPFTLLLQRALGGAVPAPLFVLTLVLPLFILYTHRSNVRRLLNGTEHRFGQRAVPRPEGP